MGIENFNKLLTEKCPTINHSVSLERFAGTRIAIDGFFVGYKYASNSNRIILSRINPFTQPFDFNERNNLWLSQYVFFLTQFLKYNITPVIVFDGDHYPEKFTTKKRETRRKRDERLQETINEFKKKYQENPDFIYGFVEEKTNNGAISRTNIITKMRKLLIEDKNIRSEDWELIQNVLSNLGFPVIKSSFEGEQLASMLTIDGYTSAVFTTDTDAFCWGAPVVISDFNNETEVSESGKVFPKVNAIYLSDILSNLDMPFDEFQNLCITLGCDFNDGIKGVGLKTCISLFEKYKSLENIFQNTNYDFTSLNYERCKSIFNYKSSFLLIKSPNDFKDEESILNFNVSKFNESYQKILQDIHFDKTGSLYYHVCQLKSPKNVKIKNAFCCIDTETEETLNERCNIRDIRPIGKQESFKIKPAKVQLNQESRIAIFESFKSLNLD